MSEFKLTSSYELSGDQPKAVDQLVEGVLRGDRFQTLLGATGTGKTFTRGQRDPTACSAPRWSSPTTRRWRRSSAPSSATSSPRTRSSISSATTITISLKPISRRRIPTSRRIHPSTRRSTGCGTPSTQALLERRDVIIVASVSCIYGLGSPEEYQKTNLPLVRGHSYDRRDMLCAARRTCSSPATTWHSSRGSSG